MLVLATEIVAAQDAKSADADKATESENPAAVTFGQPTTQRWRMGIEVTAGAGACNGITVTAPIPMDWDEQKVVILKEEKSDQVDQFRFRKIDEGVKQLLVTIPRLAAGETAKATVLMEIAKRHTLEPADISTLRLANKSEQRKLRKYLNPSPFIESRDKRIVSLSKEILKPLDVDARAWQKVEAIFDWVQGNIEYQFDPKIKSCPAALKDGVGDCEEMSSLFIALCRAQGIPARAVWIPEHTYPEFYLVDADDNGHWYPCQAAGGDHDFGRMPEDKPILQRGDNFRLPGSRTSTRYVQPTLTAKDAQANPRLTWIIEIVKPQK